MLVDDRTPPGLFRDAATGAIVLASRLTRAPLAWPRTATLAQLDIVLDWLLENRRRHGRCVVQSYVSQMVRVSQVAAARGIDLTGTQFIVGSEPLTEGKRREIEATGATVFPRYHSTELGTMGVGCAEPAEAGDFHLARDTVAVIQPQEAIEGEGAKRLYFTALLDSAPKVMINVDMGDAGVLEERPCGCLLGELGLTTHMLRVRSVERASVEGMSVAVAELARIAEETLAATCGASSLDYQWVEREDERSLTRLYLRVDPRLGAIDEAGLVRDILAGLKRKGQTGRVHADVWGQAGTVTVLRESPKPTSRGKLLPFRRERSA